MKEIFVALVVAVFSALFAFNVSAQMGAPHQFFGKVVTNGNPAPDGLAIEAYIGGEIAGNTISYNGTYGVEPCGTGATCIFYIKDPDGQNNGKEIEFFVSGVKAADYVFVSVKSTELDLSVAGNLGVCGDSFCASDESCSTCSNDCGECKKPKKSNDNGGNDGGSSGGGITTTSDTDNNVTCTENWTCSVWSDCSQDGRQFRSCTDSNGCGTEESRPITEKTCAYEPQEAARICAAGTVICSNGDLLECIEGMYWNVRQKCEYGCDPDTIKCKIASGGVKPDSVFDGLTGFLTANTFALYGLLVVLLAVLGSVVYWKKYR